jgi:hypothetical protein
MALQPTSAVAKGPHTAKSTSICVPVPLVCVSWKYIFPGFTTLKLVQYAFGEEPKQPIVPNPGDPGGSELILIIGFPPVHAMEGFAVLHIFP